MGVSSILTPEEVFFLNGSILIIVNYGKVSHLGFIVDIRLSLKGPDGFPGPKVLYLNNTVKSPIVVGPDILEEELEAHTV